MAYERIPLVAERRQDHSEDISKRRSYGWVGLFLVGASLAETCHGLLTSISGPTLQYLARNTKSTVGQASLIFSGHAVGVFIGAVCFSALRGVGKYDIPLLRTGVSLLVASLLISITPIVHELILLVFLNTIIGMTIGYFVTGLLSVYFTKWGDAGSRPIVQLHTLMFSLGGFLAPIFAKPFLEMESHHNSPAATCVRQNTTLPSSMINGSNIQSQDISDFQNPVSWSFITLGGYVFVIAAIFGMLIPCKVLDRITTDCDGTETDSKPEKPLKEVWTLLVPVFAYHFCVVSSGMVFAQFVYSIAVCSSLQMNATNASLLNSGFWGGYLLTRTSAVIVSRYLKPSTIVTAGLTGATTIMVVMSIWGEKSATVTWICSLTYGLCTSTLFPSGISWTSHVIQARGKYAFVFMAGGNIGAALIQPIGGALFQIQPFAVIYLITGLCFIAIISFLFMNLYVWRSKARDG